MSYRTAREEGLISIADAARLFGLNGNRVCNAIHAGHVIGPSRLRRKRRFYTESDIPELRNSLVAYGILKA